MIGILFHIILQPVKIDPFYFLNFIPVKIDLSVIGSKKYMIQFIFMHLIGKFHIIYKMAQFPAGRCYPEFLLQSALDRIFQRLIPSGMGAAGIGPQSSGMILVFTPFLNQHPVIIYQKNRECSVQLSLSVNFFLGAIANFPIIQIDPDQLVFHLL